MSAIEDKRYFKKALKRLLKLIKENNIKCASLALDCGIDKQRLHSIRTRQSDVGYCLLCRMQEVLFEKHGLFFNLNHVKPKSKKNKPNQPTS